jgi:hypothetical protein
MGDLRATASRLLAKQGDPATLTYITGGSVNPATGEGTAGTPVDDTANGYAGKYKTSDLANSSIDAKDVRFVCEYRPNAPQKGWDVLLLGTKYRVMDIQEIRAKQRIIIFILQLRAN